MLSHGTRTGEGAEAKEVCEWVQAKANHLCQTWQQHSDLTDPGQSLMWLTMLCTGVFQQHLQQQDLTA